MVGLGAVQETEPLFFIDHWPRRALTTTSVLSVVLAPYQLSLSSSVVQYQTVTTPSLWSSEWEMLTTRSGLVGEAVALRSHARHLPGLLREAAPEKAAQGMIAGLAFAYHGNAG